MKKNMGASVRLIRILIAVSIFTLYVFGEISGLSGTFLFIIAIFFAITSFIGFCPLFEWMGINSYLKKRITNLTFEINENN